MTAGVTAVDTDRIPVARSGLNKYITPAYLYAQRGLLARAHRTGGSQSFSDGAEAIVNFNTVDYDPASAVTTGASWHYTVPVAGWYDIRLVQGYIDAGTSWSANAGLQVNVWVGVASPVFVSYYDVGAAATSSHTVMLSGTCALSLSAGNSVNLRIDNFSGASRGLADGAAIEIYRVA